MIAIRLSFLCLFAVLLSGCGDKTHSGQKAADPHPFIFHPFLFQEEMHTQLHIPYWFNDSVISAAGIRQIIRVSYAGSEKDPDHGVGEAFPKQKTIYTFSPEGRLVLLEEIHFADGLEIARKAWSIDESSDNPILGIHAQEEKNTLPFAELEGFICFDQIRYNKSIIDLKEAGNDRRHIFLSDKKHWGVLSVDSLAHPGPRDWVVLGRPSKPLKRYQVKNKVTESNVTRYSYYKANYPRTISWNEYPFSQRRSFVYNAAGHFCGFIDSVFMDHSYVTRTLTSFGSGKNGFPSTVIRRNDTAENASKFTSLEKITYINFTPGYEK